MSPVNQHFIQILLKELPLLKDKAIIDQATEEKIQQYYLKQVTPIQSKKILMISLSVLASLLIVGGLILLIGYNWVYLSQSAQAVLAFMLLLIPQAALFYLLFIRKKEPSLAIKESVALFWSLCFGLTVAAIGRIYHLPADTETFVLIWSISSLLIIYFLNSLAVSALYLALIIYLTALMQNNNKIGLLFIPLYLAIIPHYLWVYKKQSLLRSTVYHYILIVGAVIGLGISLEKSLPGLWIIAYANLFVLCYLYSILHENKAGELSLFYSPMKVAGILGTAGLAFLCSFEWAWENIGFLHYRNFGRFHAWASFYDYFITLFFPIVCLILFYLIMKEKKKLNLVLSLSGLFMIIVYFFVSYFDLSSIASWLTNAYIFIFCLYSFFKGYRHNSLLTINCAMIFLTVTIVSRFFDENMSLLYRGIIFIICGLLILIINLKAVKNLKQGNTQ